MKPGDGIKIAVDLAESNTKEISPSQRRLGAKEVKCFAAYTERSASYLWGLDGDQRSGMRRVQGSLVYVIEFWKGLGL